MFFSRKPEKERKKKFKIEFPSQSLDYQKMEKKIKVRKGKVIKPEFSSF